MLKIMAFIIAVFAVGFNVTATFAAEDLLSQASTASPPATTPEDNVGALSDLFSKRTTYFTLLLGLPTSVNQQVLPTQNAQVLTMGLDVGHWYNALPWFGSRLRWLYMQSQTTTTTNYGNGISVTQLNNPSKYYVLGTLSLDVLALRPPTGWFNNSWGFPYVTFGPAYEYSPNARMGTEMSVGIEICPIGNLICPNVSWQYQNFSAAPFPGQTLSVSEILGGLSANFSF